MDRITSTPDALTRRKKPVVRLEKTAKLPRPQRNHVGNLESVMDQEKLGTSKLAIVGPDQMHSSAFCVPSKAVDARIQASSTRDPMASQRSPSAGIQHTLQRMLLSDNYLVR